MMLYTMQREATAVLIIVGGPFLVRLVYGVGQKSGPTGS